MSNRLTLTNYFKTLVSETLGSPETKKENYFPLGKSQLSDAITSKLADTACVFVGYDFAYKNNTNQLSKTRTIGFYIIKRAKENESEIQNAFSDIEEIGDQFILKMYQATIESRSKRPQDTVFHTIDFNSIEVSEVRTALNFYGYYYTVALTNRLR